MKEWGNQALKGKEEGREVESDALHILKTKTCALYIRSFY